MLKTFLPRIIAIVGPTASGKTALGITLAKTVGGEIVSADSRQIYRGMDIGTAKPTVAERHAVPHHLIDIRNPDEEYTVAEYQRDAIVAVDDILARNKIPFLVGGTGLYVRAIVENLAIPNIPANPKLRAEIEQTVARNGLEATFKKLIELDPEAAYVVDPKNPRRVTRALEVALATGIPFTAQRSKRTPRYDALTLCLNSPPEILHRRIDRRVDAMMRDGLVGEVKTLIRKYGRTPVAFDAIGYREIIDYVAGTLSLEEAVATIKINSWHYAKRQITWFKKDRSAHWVDDPDEAYSLVKLFLDKERGDQ